VPLTGVGLSHGGGHCQVTGLVFTEAVLGVLVDGTGMEADAAFGLWYQRLSVMGGRYSEVAATSTHWTHVAGTSRQGMLVFPGDAIFHAQEVSLQLRAPGGGKGAQLFIIDESGVRQAGLEGLSWAAVHLSTPPAAAAGERGQCVCVWGGGCSVC